MSLQLACSDIARQLDKIPELRQVNTLPPERANVFPFVIVYPSSGAFEQVADEYKDGTHNIAIECHVARKELERDSQRGVELVRLITNAIHWGVRAGDFMNFSTVPSIAYSYGALLYASNETIGYIITLQGVEINDIIT